MKYYDSMYQFNIIQDDDGLWRFEMGGINLIVDGFSLRDGKHWINNPSKAIAYFNISGHLYGVSNDLKTANTVEDFFDTMNDQYKIFKTKHLKTEAKDKQQNQQMNSQRA